MNSDRQRVTDLLGHVVLGLVAGGFALRVLTHGAGSGLGLELMADALVWITGLAWIVRAALEGRLRIWTTGLEAPLLLYAIVAGLSPLVAGHKLPAFARASSIVSAVLLYLLLVNLPDRRRTVSVVLALLAGAALVNVVTGFHQRFWILPALRRLYPPGVPIAGVAPEHEQELRWRMETDEAVGTFFLSNTMAGFLILLLPVAVALAVAAWRRKVLGDAVVWTVLAAALVAGLWSTGSVGGWVAAGAAMFAGAVFFLWTRVPASRGPLFGAGILALVGVGVWGAAGGLAPDRLREAHLSIAFRLDYWSAALKVVDESPLLGVGLDNFGHVYTRYKAPAAQETMRVHNAFLSAWAETGLVGFILFVSIWIVFLLRALRVRPLSGRAPPAGGTEPAPRAKAGGLCPAVAAGFIPGGLYAVLISAGSPVNASGLVMAIAVVLGGLLACWLAGRDWSPSDVAPALAAGVVGFLVHAAIDIDWTVPAMTQSVLLLLAAWACASDPDPERPAMETPLQGLPGRSAAVVPFLVSALVYAAFLAPRAMQAETLRDRAREAFDEARNAAAVWHGAREDADKQAAAKRVVERYDAATGLLRQAQAANPWDASLFEALARYAGTLYPAFERQGGKKAEFEFELARRALEDAIGLAPHAAGLRAQLGALWEKRADLLSIRMEKAKNEVLRGQVELNWRSAASAALAAFNEAVARYPTRAWYRFLRGRILDRSGRLPEALADLRRALELHAVQTIDRLKLPPDVKKGIENRLKELDREADGS